MNAVTEFSVGQPPRLVRILPDLTGGLRFTVMVDAPTGRRAVGVVGYEDDDPGAFHCGWYFESAGERILGGFRSRALCVRVCLGRLEEAAARQLAAGAR